MSRGTFFRLVVTSSRRMMSVTHSRKHSKNNMAFLFVFSLYQKYKDFFELKIERGGQDREREECEVMLERVNGQRWRAHFQSV